MTETLTLLLAAGSVVAAMLAVLVPVGMLQSRGLRREIALKTDALAGALAANATTLAETRADLADLRRDLAEVRRDLTAVGERVARIEGALTGPWRPPANDNPAPAPAPAAPAPASTERAP